MADIPSPMGQQMAQAAGPQQPQQAAPPPPPPTPQQLDQQQQSAPASHDDATNGRPVGTQQDQQDQQLQQDPNAKIPASQTEQAQYMQLVSRFILMTHDMRKPQGGNGMSPVETTLAQLNNPKVPISRAIGMTVANVIFYLERMAKAHGVDYGPDVLFHGADECVVAMYLMGSAAKIFKGTPPFKGLPPDGQPYAFDPGEQNLIARAKMVAVQEFGKLMQHAGLITNQDRSNATDFWKQQITHENATGKVDPSVLQALSKSGALTRAQDPGSDNSASQTSPSNPADSATPPGPPSAPPPPPPAGGGIAPPTAPGGQ
jgi:hypothetical protein